MPTERAISEHTSHEKSYKQNVQPTMHTFHETSYRNKPKIASHSPIKRSAIKQGVLSTVSSIRVAKAERTPIYRLPRWNPITTGPFKRTGPDSYSNLGGTCSRQSAKKLGKIIRV